MANAPYGLSTLMEAINHSERKNVASTALLEAYEDAIDDDIVAAVTGKDSDSLEEDMDGDGVGDDDAMQKLVNKIPPSDQMDEEQIGQITESFFDGIQGEAIM